MTPETISTRETFGQWVSLQATRLGLFKEWDVSGVLHKEDDTYEIYSGYSPCFRDGRRGLHIVVGKKLEEDKTIWYFGTFRGEWWPDMKMAEYERCTSRVLDILRDKYRVNGGRLEGFIRQAAAFEP
jgi:hypothetical protein